MSFGAPVAPTPQLVGSCTAGTTDRLAPADHCVQSAGNDGISSLRWSATANHLVSTNWDGGVRCWEVQEQGGQIRALPKAQGESFIVYNNSTILLFRRIDRVSILRLADYYYYHFRNNSSSHHNII